MDTLADSFIRQFNRFFMPGIIFLLVAILVPFRFVTSGGLVGVMELLSPLEFVLFGIVLGYILDGMGSYAWTPMYREYARERKELATRLHGSRIMAGRDPDQHIAELLMKHPATFNRIWSDRAKWVMILESSFGMMVGAGVLFIWVVFSLMNSGTIQWQAVVLATVLAFISWRSAGKGIQRMQAHNALLVAATKAVRQLDLNSDQDRIVRRDAGGPGRGGGGGRVIRVDSGNRMA